MKKLSKAVLATTIIAAVGIPSVSAASTTSSLNENQIALSAVENQSVETEFADPIFDQNYKEKAVELGLDPATVVGGYFVPFEETETSEIAPFNDFIGQSEYYLNNINMYSTTGNIIDRLAGMGPAPLTMQVSDTVQTLVSTEVTAELGLTQAQIASKIGVQYSASRTFSKTYGPINVPSGKTYTIYCYPMYNHYSYDIWEDDLINDDYIGNFYYKEPTGLYFVHQDTTGWGR